MQPILLRHTDNIPQILDRIDVLLEKNADYIKQEANCIYFAVQLLMQTEELSDSDRLERLYVLYIALEYLEIYSEPGNYQDDEPLQDMIDLMTDLFENAFKNYTNEISFLDLCISLDTILGIRKI